MQSWGKPEKGRHIWGSWRQELALVFFLRAQPGPGAVVVRVFINLV